MLIFICSNCFAQNDSVVKKQHLLFGYFGISYSFVPKTIDLYGMDWGLAYGFKKSNYIVFKKNYSTSLQLMDNSFSYIVNNALMFGKGKDYRKALRGIYQAGICAGNASYNHELGNVERYQYLGVALEYTLILSYPNLQ